MSKKNKIKTWRGETKRLRVEIAVLKVERTIAVDALKAIATDKCRSSMTTADRALQNIGLRPVVIDASIPPDRVYSSNVRTTPTDYF